MNKTTIFVFSLFLTSCANTGVSVGGGIAEKKLCSEPGTKIPTEVIWSSELAEKQAELKPYFEKGLAKFLRNMACLEVSSVVESAEHNSDTQWNRYPSEIHYTRKKDTAKKYRLVVVFQSLSPLSREGRGLFPKGKTVGSFKSLLIETSSDKVLSNTETEFRKVGRHFLPHSMQLVNNISEALRETFIDAVWEKSG